jgi:hypothetical protein
LIKKESDLGKRVLRNFVPIESIDYIDELVQSLRVNFKIVNPRKTKLGDCRYPKPGKSTITITINCDLPKLQFLITTIHELAHAKTYREFKYSVPAHGTEWKENFKYLFFPILKEPILTKEEIQVVQNILSNVKASSCSNNALNNYLYKEDDTIVFLKDITPSAIFELNKRRFKIISKARTRFLCTEVDTGKQYKIHGLANIKVIN